MRINELSLEEKICQMLVVGFRGLKIEDVPWLSNSLTKGHLGGVILFEKDYQTGEKRNISEPTQLQTLIAQLKRNSKFPLFIAIDQEGGAVARLNSSNGFEDFPSANEIANKNDISFAEETYSKLSNLLSQLGFNVNFAPVLDLCINPENTVIVQKKRCFSKEPEKVVRFSKIFIQNHLRRNVLPVAKHFPGHGSSYADTHKQWVDVTNLWTTTELKPYELLRNQDSLPAVMVGHLFNKHIDPIYPATLSHIWIEEILRKQIGFDGLVFTDDLQMKAIADNFTLEEIVQLGFNAGVDIFLFANQIENDEQIISKFDQIVKELIYQNRISLDRINKSVERIINFKNKFMLN
ncbi:glycoside hydrolase family 3 protein [Bacteroidetes/Chlorobi group bacterium Naka2016]|jgi:beta-N-acetylhexosaminidase|nr:MAG: glycoside hydrolase family 3 protein [Bacteroidetes/Chlorobi group bacterium Naka2016]